jgi:hypothetical protein
MPAISSLVITKTVSPDCSPVDGEPPRPADEWKPRFAKAW